MVLSLGHIERMQQIQEQIQQPERKLSHCLTMVELIIVVNIFNSKKKLVGGAPLHVKRAETPLSTSFFLGL